MDPAIEAVMMPGVRRTYNVDHPALRWTVHPEHGNYPMFWIRRRSPKMAIVYAHPNDCDLGMTSRLLYALSEQLEAIVVAPEYFGYGLLDQRPRNIVTSTALVAHAIKVVSLKHSKLPLLVVGQSIGTAMVAEALRYRQVAEAVRGTVLVAPFASVREMAETVGLEVDRQVDNINVARRLRNVLAHSPKLRIMIVHGDRDRLIPADQSRRIVAALEGRAVLDVVPGGTHTDFGGGAPALAKRIATLVKNSSTVSQ